MMDKIIISGARFSVHLGVSDEERREKQTIIVDCELFYDIRKAGVSDSITDTINYSEAHTLLRQTIESAQWCLIEAVAERSATAILERFSAVSGVHIVVKKLQPLKHIDYCAVDILRER